MPPTIEDTIILWTPWKEEMLRNEESDGRAPQTTGTPEGNILWGRANQKSTYHAGRDSEDMCLPQARDWVKTRKKISAESLQLSAGTTPTGPVCQRKTSGRAFKFKCFQTESILTWLAQGHTNPEVPSGRSGLESRLTTPQICHHPYNTLRFQGVEVPG